MSWIGLGHFTASTGSCRLPEKQIWGTQALHLVSSVVLEHPRSICGRTVGLFQGIQCWCCIPYYWAMEENSVHYHSVCYQVAEIVSWLGSHSARCPEGWNLCEEKPVFFLCDRLWWLSPIGFSCLKFASLTSSYALRPWHDVIMSLAELPKVRLCMSIPQVQVVECDGQGIWLVSSLRRPPYEDVKWDINEGLIIFCSGFCFMCSWQWVDLVFFTCGTSLLVLHWGFERAKSLWPIRWIVSPRGLKV